MFWILTACTSAPVGGPKGVTAEPAGAQHLVRLTHLQWEHAVVALLHLPGESGWLPTLVPDPLVSRFDSDAEGLYVDPTLWMQYQAAAEGLGLRVISEPESYAAVVPAEDREVWLTSFAGRAFRRAPTQAEVDGLAVVFDDAAAEFPEETPFRAGVRAVVTAVLQSPAFLYRTEGVHSDDPARLGPEELASRVAFALWNGPPDDALLAAAAAGLPPEVLAAEVDRMLADPRARDTVAHLHRQLYHVDGYENIFPPERGGAGDRRVRALDPRLHAAGGARVRGRRRVRRRHRGRPPHPADHVRRRAARRDLRRRGRAGRAPGAGGAAAGARGACSRCPGSWRGRPIGSSRTSSGAGASSTT
jgi:hypothetical protein